MLLSEKMERFLPLTIRSLRLACAWVDITIAGSLSLCGGEDWLPRWPRKCHRYFNIMGLFFTGKSRPHAQAKQLFRADHTKECSILAESIALDFPWCWRFSPGAAWAGGNPLARSNQPTQQPELGWGNLRSLHQVNYLLSFAPADRCNFSSNEEHSVKINFF